MNPDEEPLAVGAPRPLPSWRRWRDTHPDRYAALQRDYAAKRRRNHPEEIARAKARYTLGKHGLSQEQYDAILESQGGRCAICGSTDPSNGSGRFFVDHDHRHCPGAYGCRECVRGLLCRPCNMALGLLKDDADVVGSAARYLNRD